MKEEIRNTLLNSKDPVNELDIYFTGKQSERDMKWSLAIAIILFSAMVLTLFIINR